MRRKNWSSYERKQVQQVTEMLCRSLGLDPEDPEYQSIGWEGFLEAYEQNRNAFRHSGERGWKYAAELICQRLRAAKAERDFLLYQSVSLDAPVNQEYETPRVELYHGKRGDFQPGVCFRCYLDDLGNWSPDARTLAYALSNGDSVDEARQDRGWDRDRTDRALEIVRLAMREYLEI